MSVRIYRDINKIMVFFLLGLLLLGSCEGTNDSYEGRVYVANQTTENLVLVYKNFCFQYQPARFEIAPQSERLIVKDEIYFDQSFTPTGSVSTGEDMLLIFNYQDSLVFDSDSCFIQDFELAKLNMSCSLGWERIGNRDKTYRFHITDTLLSLSRLRDTL